MLISYVIFENFSNEDTTAFGSFLDISVVMLQVFVQLQTLLVFLGRTNEGTVPVGGVQIYFGPVLRLVYDWLVLLVGVL